MNKILRAIGMILLLIVIYTAATTIVTFIVGIGYAVSNLGQIMEAGGQLDYYALAEEMISGISAQTPLILLISVAITLPVYYLIYRKRKQELRMFCSVRPIGPLNVPVLIILALSVNFILELILSLMQQIGFFHELFESYEQVAELITGGEFVISLVTIGIIAPVFEEILFRGLVFGELRKVSKLPLAIVLQALIFGIYHMNVIQGSYAFLLGILLGFVYYRSSTIIAPVIIHITINSSSLIMTEFLTEAQYEQFGLPIIVASLILFVVTGIYIFVSKGFRRAMDDGLYHSNREDPRAAHGPLPYGPLPSGHMPVNHMAAGPVTYGGQPFQQMPEGQTQYTQTPGIPMRYEQDAGSPVGEQPAGDASGAGAGEQDTEIHDER
jgi:membrane protease YdiL (CAAX protease family)